MKAESSLPHSQAPAICPILSYVNLVHASPSKFLMFHFNIILSSTPRSFKWVYVTTTRRVLRLCKEKRPPDMEGSCEYTE
jgi:hypothetical protein